MGHCCSKSVTIAVDDVKRPEAASAVDAGTNGATNSSKDTPAHSFSSSPFQTHYPAGVDPSPSWTPKKFFKWPFPPPSPAKPIMSAIMKRQATKKVKENPVADSSVEERVEPELDKTFGFSKNLCAKYELGKEVGRGHFGHTCAGKAKKGQLKNQPVAIKIISKVKVCVMFCILLLWLVFESLMQNSEF